MMFRVFNTTFHAKPAPACGAGVRCLIYATIALAVLASPSITRGERLITIHGSDTMLILNEEFTAEYTSHNPAVRFKVLGGGSGLGIAALLAGKTDIAAASRAMKESEMLAFERTTGVRPKEIVVALDGIGVYVHNNNPVSRLTISQFGGILRGEIRNWAEVGGPNRRIDVYNRDRNSGTRAFVEEHVLASRPFSTLAREVSSTSMLVACVARNQNAIAYGGIAYSQGAHIIRLAESSHESGVWPSRENVTSGKYPLSRPLYFYVNPESMDGGLRAFLNWVQGPEGQNIVRFVGYYPAPAPSPPQTPVPKPVTPTGSEPIRLTPANAKQHGFDVSASMDNKSPDLPGRTLLTIDIRPAFNAPQGVRIFSFRVAEKAALPRTVVSILREALVENMSLYLIEEDLAPEAAAYVVEPRLFLSPE